MAKTVGGTPATVALDKAGVTYHVREYSVTVAPGKGGDTTYGEAVAVSLGVQPDRVFKTLVASVDDSLTVAVVPVTATLDLKSLAQAVGGKRADMAEVALAERATGYVIGGISPLGQRKQLPTVIDETVDLFDTIFVSAGKRGLQLEVNPDDLVRLTAAVVAPVARQ